MNNESEKNGAPVGEPVAAPAAAPAPEAPKAAPRPAPKPKEPEGPVLGIASSPHIGAKDTTRTLMLDVLIALALPLIFATFYFFGPRALIMTIVSVVFCVGFEYLYRKILKKPQSIRDLSAAVTGVLLAFCLPVTVPYWVVIVGAFFAIVVVKQLYGGIGKNFMNPALAARVFLFCFPGLMNTWVTTRHWAGLWSAADAVTSATPMAALHAGALPEGISLLQMFTGVRGGSMGEVSAVLLLLGGAYLVIRKVIRLRIPVLYIGTVAVLTFLFPLGGCDRLEWMLFQVMGGGLLLGAIFMATDYVTSPVTKRGQTIYAIGCGALTVFLRYFGSYPEGVSFAILIMNACTWLFDKWGMPHRFGTPHKLAFHKGKEAAK